MVTVEVGGELDRTEPVTEDRAVQDKDGGQAREPTGYDVERGARGEIGFLSRDEPPCGGEGDAERNERFFGQSSQNGDEWEKPEVSMGEGPEKSEEEETFASIDESGETEIGDGEVEKIEEGGDERNSVVGELALAEDEDEQGGGGDEERIDEEEPEHDRIPGADATFGNKVDGSGERGDESAEAEMKQART